MEEMMVPERVSILVDLSLHEMADHLFGGDYDAGPDRGKTALKLGLPTILVPGNIDFLVTGPLENARRLFPDRPYHVHNAAITVVRSTHEEIECIELFNGQLQYYQRPYRDKLLRSSQSGCRQRHL